ncbi:MAG TPA: cytochrome C, partial [Noviherbaspirillum sp.]|nr:cytochrome C [Noviherbaspirillum sp.]
MKGTFIVRLQTAALAVALLPAGFAAAQGAAGSTIAFQPPAADAIPDDEFGKVVRQGEQIFLDTQKNAGRF